MTALEGPVLVTGCAGFIGYCVAERLLAEGIDVVGIDDLSETYYAAALKQVRLERLDKARGFRFVRLDLCDSTATAAAFAAARPTHVLHLAAQASVMPSFRRPELYVRANVIGTQSVLDATRALPKVAHLVYASTSSVYGRAKNDAPFSEDQPTDTPISVYGASKVASEAMMQAYADHYGLPVTGLRFFKVYGPWGRPDTVFFKFIDRIWRDQPVKLHNFGEVFHAFTYIDDAVKGVMAALATSPSVRPDGRHPIYNIGNDRSEHLGRCLDLIEAALGKTAQREFVPLPAGDRSHSRANIARAREDLGFAPEIGVAEGIPRLADWYREVCVPLGEPLDRL